MATHDPHKSNVEHHHHHILPNRMIMIIGGCLGVLTVITVALSKVHLGSINFLVAMAVASVKAGLVALFFMNLKYDRRENSVIFFTSLLFLAIFLVLTSTDLFFRGDVYTKGNVAAAAPQAKSKLKDPWLGTPQLVARGKELFSQQCVACHGAEGHGDGPAAGSLTPKPRNFTIAEGWKNGRKASQIFKTLKEGIPGSSMGSFASLPADDRWALAHYVISMGPKVEADTPADLAKIGIDPTKQGGGEEEEKTISVELAMERMAQPEPKIVGVAHPVSVEVVESAKGPGAQLYAARCLECHGAQGEGGIKTQNLGVNPKAFVVTAPLSGRMKGMQSAEAFAKVVAEGLPGRLMPGNGQLSGSEVSELYQYVKSLSAAR